MPRILFDTEQLKTGIDSPSQVQARMTGICSDRELLKKRSAKYVNLFSSIDQKSLTEVAGWQTLMDEVTAEFGTAALNNLPLGIVAKCFLGDPYEVHILDLSGEMIIEHYKIFEPMPGEFEKARTLALHDAYCFIEVYPDKLILVKDDGSTTKV